MACGGCEEKRKNLQSEWRVYGDKKPKAPEWHIVVVSRGVSDRAEPLLMALRELTKDTWIDLTLVDTSCPSGVWVKPCDVRDLYNAGYVGMPAETNIPRAFNAGAARVRTSRWTLLLHDDVTIPPGTEWLDRLVDCLEEGAGLVVPHVTGQCNNPLQAMSQTGAIYHSQEYVASACMAFHTGRLLQHGFNDAMVGYDWWQVEMQLKMARQGGATLVADCTVDHAGRGTYTDDEAAEKPFRHNLDLMNKTAGWPTEFQSRPRYPRIHIARQSPDDHKALCVVLDPYWEGSLDLVAAIKRIKQDGSYAQVCVVDRAPSAKTRERLQQEIGRGDLLYCGEYMADPIAQAISMSDYEQVTAYDTRCGAGHPVSRKTLYSGHRLRCGDHYDLPSRMTRYDIGMLTHFALGDTLMMTPAIKAFKAQYPWISLTVHHGWDAAQLLLHNPDIDNLLQYSKDQIQPPTSVVDVGTGNGGERMILAPYRDLGLREPERVKLQYFRQPDEKQAALDLLDTLGVEVKSNVKLAGIQRHGTWGYKAWLHTESLMSRMTDLGWTVIEFGTDAAKMGDTVPGVIRLPQQPIRIAAAVISLLDVMIGYVSGLTFLATALGVPVIANAGPEDCSKLLGICGPNIVVLKKRSPKMCEDERGTSCRAQGNNAVCPFRENSIGADCVDEVRPDDVIAELDGLPRWGKPIANR